MTYHDLITDLIADIERFAAASGLAPATVTSKAVSNSRLYHKLKRGDGCTIRTAARVRAFIAENPPKEKARATQ